MKRTLCWLGFLALVAYAIAGSIALYRQGDARAVLAGRFLDMEALSLRCNGGEVSAEGKKAVIRWEACERESLTATSISIPLHGGADRGIQLDIDIGGAQNAQGLTRTGYRVWLEASLLDSNGDALAVQRVEVPLESENERSRLYSLIVRATERAAAWRLAVSVDAGQPSLPAGYIELSYAEVLAL